MKARFRIVQPVDTGSPDYDICGQAVGNVIPSGVLVVPLKIEVAGEVVIDTADLFVYDLNANPVSITLTNGIVVELTLENVYYYTLDIAYPMPLNPRVWDNTTLRIVSTGATGCYDFDRVFEVYDFDLGNNPNINNIAGDPIDYNPNMDIVLCANTINVLDKVFSSFTCYRKPFTDLIQIYSLSSSPGTCAYYNDEDDTLLFTGNLGYKCNGEEITIKQILTNGTESCESTILVPVKKWIPDWSVAVSCTNCDSDCLNTLSDNTAITTIDFSTLTSVFRNDLAIYPYQDQQIIYNLYNYAGDLVDSYVYNFRLGSIASTFTPTAGQWSGFRTPNLGDYVLKTSLIIVGLDTKVEIDSTGELVSNKWYRITAPAAGDFTAAGAANNNLGTDFAYNGGIVVWDVATVNLLSNLVECFKTTVLTSCMWFDIKKTACSAYTIYNRSFSSINIKLSSMNADGTFTVVAGYESYLLTGLATLSIDLSTDNIYKLEQLQDPLSEVEGELVTYIIYAYCNIQNCSLEFINKVLCDKETDTCKDYFKDVYDYIAFVTTIFTYFSILNSEYNFNYFYDGISPSKLVELQSAKGVLDRLAEYCVASTTCDICGSTASCNCNKYNIN